MPASRATKSELRPSLGGTPAYRVAQRARGSFPAWALIAACIAGCDDASGDDEPSPNKTAPVAGDNSGAPPNTPGAGPSGSNDPGMRTPDDPALPDAGRVWPSCGASFDDDDGGVSPYADSCAIDERFGVFADPNVAPDAFADGSREHPFATLELAVATAVNEGKNVFACEGTYREPLRIGTALSDGLRVYGGLSCATFAIESDSARSHVIASGPGAALIVADTRDVLIERFVLEHAPAAMAVPGTSYVGAFIQDARRVVLRDVLLHAHDGERGKDGAPPASAAAGNGMIGSDGGAACSARPNRGGAALSNMGCRDQPGAASGSGGGGGEGTGNGGNGTWFGAASVLGESTAEWSCIAGQGAPPMTQPGFMGPPGRGGRGFGALLGTGLVGFGGQDGTDGGPGQGGGGGGGAKAPTSCASGTAVGASGGGGGTGGCGGKGGEGGGPGGASIGLLMSGSSVRLERSEIRYGNGGDGGDGALGQKGGRGAPGGRGGKGASGSSDACDGAAGSNGGDGGNGGGGNGGHAFGVLYAGDAPKLTDVVGEQSAAMRRGGAPGEGPVADIMDSIGTPGQTAFVFEF
jgi:hypothetical protein